MNWNLMLITVAHIHKKNFTRILKRHRKTLQESLRENLLASRNDAPPTRWRPMRSVKCSSAWITSHRTAATKYIQSQYQLVICAAINGIMT